MKFFSEFLGCAQLIGTSVTVAHHIKLQSDVRTVIELIPLPIGLYDFPLILSKFFSLATLARLEMRNSGIQIYFINHSPQLFFMFFLFRKPSSQSAPNHAQYHIKLHLNAPKSFCRAPEPIRG